MRIAVVAGVRPQYIKLAAIQHGVLSYNAGNSDPIQLISINAGQHYDRELTDLLFDELGIEFTYRLTHSNTDPIEILSESIRQLYNILSECLVDYVVVLGDATTTLAAALASSRALIPVVHVEAGVRSGDIRSFEEIHRRVVSHIASIHFCSTQSGIRNLKREGIKNKVYWIGDIAFDFFSSVANSVASGIEEVASTDYVLLTIHKASNLRNPKILTELLIGLSSYKRQIIFVTHPKTNRFLKENSLDNFDNIRIISSLSYKQMVSALKGCSFVITDSGGLQREAYYLRKRCLVRRETLGWRMLVDAGINALIGENSDDVVRGLDWMEEKLRNNPEFEYIGDFIRPNSCQYALETLRSNFGSNRDDIH